MGSKFLNVDRDGTLSGNSDTAVASQKAVKTYVDQGLSDLAEELPSIATVNTAGLVKPDGETITISPSGVLTAVGSGGGGGAGDSMQYLFGDGRDSNVTLSSDSSFSEPKNFINFTLNAGVTLTHTNTPGLLIIRCTQTCTINGIINMNGKGFAAGQGYSEVIKSEWVGGFGNTTAGTGVGRGAANGGTWGEYNDRGGITAGTTGGNFDYSKHLFLAQQLKFEQIPLLGSGGTSGDHTTGGNGGGGILIFAPTIQFGANAQLLANGNTGTNLLFKDGAIYRNQNGGGGGGGTVTLVARSIVGTPTVTCAGGASACYCGAGGAGGLVQVIVP